MPGIAHLVNPFLVPAGSNLAFMQQVTFKSILNARDFAGTQAQVDLLAVGYAEDTPAMPEGFRVCEPLQHSVLDKGTFVKQRKLPLIAELIERLAANSTAEYLIYTNADIALMPQFYLVVNSLLQQGHDALLINRRGISTQYNSVDQLPLMYSDYGKPHPGFDCFVFKRELVSKLKLGSICIGIPFLEVSLVHNLIACAGNLKLIDDLHLTFHLGTEVMPPVDEEYYRHNRSEYENNIYPFIKDQLDIRKFPYAELPFYKRMMKWALNPVFRTHQVTEMEGKGLLRLIKYKLDGLRFSLLEKIK